MGFAKASPTMVTLSQRLRSTSLQIRCGSSPSFEIRTTVPPCRSGTIDPSHIPVPCIRGQAARLTGKASAARMASMTAGMSSTPVGALTPMVATVPIRAPMNWPCVYITPLGMPVVPPV